MKKALIIFSLSVFVFNITNSQTIYSLAVNDVDGNPIEMSRMTKKKTLFIVLPSGTDDTLDTQITKFAICGIQPRNKPSITDH